MVSSADYRIGYFIIWEYLGCRIRLSKIVDLVGRISRSALMGALKPVTPEGTGWQPVLNQRPK